MTYCSKGSNRGGGLSSFGGWFLPDGRPILLVNETNDPADAVRCLIRLGFDDAPGYLSGGMWAWHVAGRESASIAAVTVQKLCQQLDERGDVGILDIRSDYELNHVDKVPDAHHIHITQLPDRVDEVPRDRPVYVFCPSGLRATIGASLLRRAGIVSVTVVLGGLAGWSSVTCPLDHPARDELVPRW